MGLQRGDRVHLRGCPRGEAGIVRWVKSGMVRVEWPGFAPSRRHKHKQEDLLLAGGYFERLEGLKILERKRAQAKRDAVISDAVHGVPITSEEGLALLRDPGVQKEIKRIAADIEADRKLLKSQRRKY